MLIALHDKQTIADYCRQKAAMHLYEIGDLDDFFWPYTCWYGWREQAGAPVSQLALIYFGLDVPVVLANTHGSSEQADAFITALAGLLPKKIYSHLSPEAAQLLAPHFHLEHHGDYLKMALTAPEKVSACDDPECVRLGAADMPAISALYETAYPGNWFDQRMLATGCYFGIFAGDNRAAGQLLSISGVHVFSRDYKVAALGNVTTHPDSRGRGLAKRTVAQLCRHLWAQGVSDIGLNVNANNSAAVAAYTALGFSHAMNYSEYMLRARA